MSDLWYQENIIASKLIPFLFNQIINEKSIDRGFTYW